MFRRFDVISPWTVGNVFTEDGKKHAATATWKDDLAASKKAEMGHLPVVYPGFSWTNLRGKGATRSRGGAGSSTGGSS